MTIDELARRTGMTVRNIRAHQSRGLLPPPEVRGRTGYYGEGHVGRIELIRDLQAEGLNLEAIRRLLDGVGESSEAVLDFTRTLKTPFEDEEPEVVQISELAEGLADPNPELLVRAERLGLCARSARAATRWSARACAGPGWSWPSWGSGRRRRSRWSRRCTAMPAASPGSSSASSSRPSGSPSRRPAAPRRAGPQVRDALERLRPLATESLLAVFKIAMTEETDKAVARTLQRGPAALLAVEEPPLELTAAPG